MTRALLGRCLLSLLAVTAGLATARGDAAHACEQGSPSRVRPEYVRAAGGFGALPRRAPAAAPAARVSGAGVHVSSSNPQAWQVPANRPRAAGTPAAPSALHSVAPRLEARGRLATLVPTHPLTATSGSSRGRHVPLNGALGGPATFDARKLVRR
jgi:hypothetical protein